MLTVMITTMNRSDFLTRLLNYYAEIGFKHCIAIGDSSNAEHLEKTKKTIKNLEGKLKIIYNEYPGLNDVECMQQVLKSVSTPYAVNLADDDFISPDCLEKCLRFLENNPGYDAAHGAAIVFTLQSSGSYGKFASTDNYALSSIETDTSSQRILDYLKNYSVNMFSLHRTESWQAMLRDIDAIPDRSFAGELFPCCLSVIRGKIKQLDCFYLMRQDHGIRSKLPDKNEWIKSPNYEPAYNIFIDRLSEELSRQDGIALDESRSIIEKAFKSYLDGLTNSMRFSRLGRAARYIPGMNRVIMYSKQKRFGDISLSALLNPASPYHKDFMPIYNIITNPPKKNS